eukprot:scaffold3587_cov364-Prasinococcus_capsulatus_cf.AAC.9
MTRLNCVHICFHLPLGAALPRGAPCAGAQTSGRGGEAMANPWATRGGERRNGVSLGLSATSGVGTEECAAPPFGVRRAVTQPRRRRRTSPSCPGHAPPRRAWANNNDNNDKTTTSATAACIGVGVDAGGGVGIGIGPPPPVRQRSLAVTPVTRPRHSARMGVARPGASAARCVTLADGGGSRARRRYKAAPSSPVGRYWHSTTANTGCSGLVPVGDGVEHGAPSVTASA